MFFLIIKRGNRSKTNDNSGQKRLILIGCVLLGLLGNFKITDKAFASELEINKNILANVKNWQVQQKGYPNKHGCYNDELYNNCDFTRKSSPNFNNKNKEASSLLKKAINYAHKGYTRLALSSIEKAIRISKKNHDLGLLAQAEGVLGNIHFINGNYQDAIVAYQKSLDLAISIQDNLGITIAWNNLTNTWSILEQDYRSQVSRIQNNSIEVARLEQLAQDAQITSLNAASQALVSSKDQITTSAVRAWINWHRINSSSNIEISVPLSILSELPASRSQVYLLIDLAKLNSSYQIEALNQAIDMAVALQDNRALSFALGALGNTFEQNNQISQAIIDTERAILTAHQDFSIDSLYRWQWQAGRLYKTLGEIEQAKNYYRQAISTLESERGETISVSKRRRWDFQDQIEPVYRELIELLLDSNQTQEIKEALHIYELLSLNELKNFFQDDCVEISKVLKSNLQQNLQQTNVAVISSIILPEKTYIILQLPNGQIKQHTVNINSLELEEEIQAWHKLLINVSTNRYLKSSQYIYDILIRPLEQDLLTAKPDSLVMVKDGILRNVPFAALHDKKSFLIEKYPITDALGLNFINIKDIKKNKKLSVSAFGLSNAIGDFASLPNVVQEITNIDKIIKTKVFLNEQFTVNRFRKQIQQENSIIHLATHGKFDGTVENSFIQAFDDRLSLNQLELLLSDYNKNLDLLVLSACETSIGDDRSVLGLAGVMVRSGTRTAVGSLWSVNDATTKELMTDFYQYLSQNEMSKTAALRQAQLNQIKNPLGHPATWSAFIMIGNWQ